MDHQRKLLAETEKAAAEEFEIRESFDVETVGFNDKSWLDGLGLPHSEELRVTERFQQTRENAYR